jgi:predicted nucleotidyltransferase
MNNEIKNLLPKFSGVFRAFDLQNVYLFGSALSNKFNWYSDIDLYFDALPLGMIPLIKKELNKITSRKISFTTIESIANHKDKQHIINSKIIIYKKN